MPALPPVPGVLRIQLKWTYSNDLDVLCRLYMSYSGTPPSSTQLDTFAGVVYTAVANDLMPFFHPDTALTECIVTDLTTASSATGTHVASTSGAQSGGPLGAGTAFLLNFTVDRRYRGGKPRMYLPAGTSSELLDAQTWSAAYVTSIVTNYNNVIADAQAAPWSGATIGPQVNVSYYEGFTAFETPSGRYKNLSKLRVGGPLVDNVVAVAGHHKLASQRRRNQTA